MKILTVHYQETDDDGDENEFPLEYLVEAIEQGGGWVFTITDGPDD